MKVIEVLAWLALGAVSFFLTVGTYGEVFIGSNKANTAVYTCTTVVSHRLESRQELNTFLDHL